MQLIITVFAKGRREARLQFAPSEIVPSALFQAIEDGAICAIIAQSPEAALSQNQLDWYPFQNILFTCRQPEIDIVELLVHF